VGGEHLCGVEFDRGDVVLVGEREDAVAGVGGADAEVVPPARRVVMLPLGSSRS
jgi:hypothetical protein